MRKKIAHGTRNTYERHGCRCSECRAANAARTAAYKKDNREYFREASNKSYAQNRERWLQRKREVYDPIKGKAHNLVRKAIKEGLLTPGHCEVGNDCSGNIHAHHDDYSKPLDVRWLCQRHHRLHHLATNFAPIAPGPVATL